MLPGNRVSRHPLQTVRRRGGDWGPPCLWLQRELSVATMELDDIGGVG